MIPPFNANSDLSSLTRSHPCLIPFFFEKGLKYCSGDERTLIEICTENDWSLAALLEELGHRLATESDDQLPSWLPGSEAALIDYLLQRFHRGHRRDFKTIHARLEQAVSEHTEQTTTLHGLALVLRELDGDIEPHMCKEEQILFPMILGRLGYMERPMMCGMGPAGPVRVMMMEHDNALELLDTLARITHHFTPPDWAGDALRDVFALIEKLDGEIRRHIYLENDVLFPMVLAMNWQRERSVS